MLKNDYLCIDYTKESYPPLTEHRFCHQQKGPLQDI